MTKAKRIMAVLLSAIMIFTTMSVAASAAHSPYLDGAITDQYNSIDRVELELNQKASLLLDQLDVMLQKEDIYIDIPLIGSIDLRSTDAALDSIYSITGNWLFGDLTVGDLGVLEDSRSEIASVRRVTEGKTDMDVIRSLVAYLAGCAEDGLLNIVNKNFNWGILKGFLPPEFRIIIDDVPKFLKETLWDVLHPVNEVTMPTGTTLDSIAQYALDHQVGAEEGSPEALEVGFEGILPGFTVNLATDSAYRVVDEVIFSVLNELIVPLLNSELKTTIRNAVESNQADGGELYLLVDTNYVIEEYTYDRTQSLVLQLNDMFKGVVDEMLLPGQFTWNATGTGDPLAVLEDNLERLLLTIIRAGGDTFEFNVENPELPELGDYIARVAVENFVKHIDFDGTEEMEEVAYIGLRELCIRLIPEGTYPIVPTDSTKEGYKAAILELGADLAVYYLNANIGLNLSYDTTAEDFISEFIEWCEPYINGLFDATELNTVRAASADPDGWDEINAIIWKLFPKSWMDYEQMFKDADGTLGTADELTFESLIHYFLDAVINMDLGALYTFFSYNTDGPLYEMKAYELIIDFIANILDGAFSVGTTACVPDGITNFESLLANDMAHTKTILKNILVALRDKEGLDETVVNIVTMLLGFADPQSLGDVDMDIDGRIGCTANTAMSTTLRISNRSDGVNSAWKNTNGVLEQDQMYKIEVISVASNNAGVTCTLPATTVIPANGYIDVTVAGTVAATTEVRFDLTYYILDEAGQRINNGTPLVKSVYSNFYTTDGGNYSVTSAEVTANNVTFDDFSTYLYTTDVYDAALFSIMATNNSGLLTSAKDIRRAVVTGTLPTGLAANNPTSGPIVALEDSSISTDTYGSVNPYVADIDPDDPQPYGVYPVTIQFEVCSTGSNNGTLSEARNHTIVVYDDFNLDGILGDVMDRNRQRSDYAADADTEWAAYQTAVSNGFALLQGDPNHNYMFDDTDATIEGTQNEYYVRAEAVQAAVDALDAKAITDSAKLAALETVVNTYKDVDSDDYVLFTYDRFEDAYDRAAGLVNSQVAPEGEEATFVAPAIAAFDLVYAKAQLELWGGRLIKKAPVTTYLMPYVTEAQSLENNKNSYATDLWADVQTALDTAEGYLENISVVLQTQINHVRIDLIRALNALKPKYLEPVGNTVIDSKNFVIYGLAEDLSSLSGFYSAASGYSLSPAATPYSGSKFGTGSTVSVSDSSGVVATYKVVIFGDVDGDAAITMDDYYLVDEYSRGVISSFDIGKPAIIAADLDRNGEITSEDADKIYDHADGYAFIDQSDPTA